MYTLNVDDVETAVAERVRLPRPLRVVTPWRHDGFPGRAPERERFAPRVLEVVHLNGVVSHDPHSVTFSTWQYAPRVHGSEPLYAALARELVAYPFVFVGTRLDEVNLWHVSWLPMTAGQFAAEVLGAYWPPRMISSRPCRLARRWS